MIHPPIQMSIATINVVKLPHVLAICPSDTVNRTGNRFLAKGWSFDLSVPSPTQTFAQYMANFVEWSPITINTFTNANQRQQQAFADFCQTLNRCTYDATALACVRRFADGQDDDDWDTLPPDQFAFLLGLIALVTWKIGLEVLKLGIILWTFRAHQIIAPDITLDFLRTSPFLPLLYMTGIDAWDVVLQYANSTADFLRFVVYVGSLLSMD